MKHVIGSRDGVPSVILRNIFQDVKDTVWQGRVSVPCHVLGAFTS
jgi:hypothetical protein